MTEECPIAWEITGVLTHLASVTNGVLPLQTNSFDMIIMALQMINLGHVDPMVEITLTR